MAFQASHRYARISPRKVRYLAALVRGKFADDALGILHSYPHRGARMIEKALSLPADAIIMDIEDGVALAEKETARRQIAASLDAVAVRREQDPNYKTPARYVRIAETGGALFHFAPSLLCASLS